MGPSGSGKSTLLNIMGLLEPASAGRVMLQDQDVSTLDDSRLAPLRCRTIGFIFQSFHLLPYLTARQNIDVALDYGGHGHRAKRSQELLDKVQMLHRADAYPATLSGGEKQRVAIARALANNPLLLLADEPTGALDSGTGNQIMDLIQGLHRQGMTVVLITHDGAIGRRAGRILALHDGQFIG
jgi:putative ABC transport system ATP-binding protein